jgi:hypothetical protein
MKSKDAGNVIVSVTKKGKLSEKHDTTGPNRHVFAYFRGKVVRNSLAVFWYIYVPRALGISSGGRDLRGIQPVSKLFYSTN